MPSRRLPALAPALLAAAVALGGCGGDDPPARALAPVRLELVAPADASTIDADAVEVRGRVTPASAEVRVLGDPVDVVGGAFSRTVPLEEGANLVDVTAGARGRRPASTALRVVREVPVEVPDLAGEAPEAAVERLEALGLVARQREGGGILDDLLPSDPGVCGTDPGPGTSVRPGTTVEVEVARAC